MTVIPIIKPRASLVQIINLSPEYNIIPKEKMEKKSKFYQLDLWNTMHIREVLVHRNLKH